MLNYQLTRCQCLQFCIKTKTIVYLIAAVPATQTIHAFKIETVSLLLLPFPDSETHRI